MKNKNNEMITVTVYADDTRLFSETECDYNGNMIDLVVPKWVVEDWYKENEKEYKESCAFELNISEDEANFDTWIRSVYICDDFIGFYDYCIIKGVVPDLVIIDKNDKVYFEDDNGNKQIVFEGTVDECRRWGKYYNWKWLEQDLKLMFYQRRYCI